MTEMVKNAETEGSYLGLMDIRMGNAICSFTPLNVLGDKSEATVH